MRMKKRTIIQEYQSLRVKATYTAAAKLVVLYGDLYLPIFERVHSEAKKMESFLDLKLLATQLAQL